MICTVTNKYAKLLGVFSIDLLFSRPGGSEFGTARVHAYAAWNTLQHLRFLERLGWDAHASPDPHADLQPQQGGIRSLNASARRLKMRLKPAAKPAPHLEPLHDAKHAVQKPLPAQPGNALEKGPEEQRIAPGAGDGTEGANHAEHRMEGQAVLSGVREGSMETSLQAKRGEEDRMVLNSTCGVEGAAVTADGFQKGLKADADRGTETALMAAGVLPESQPVLVPASGSENALQDQVRIGAVADVAVDDRPSAGIQAKAQLCSSLNHVRFQEKADLEHGGKGEGCQKSEEASEAYANKFLLTAPKEFWPERDHSYTLAKSTCAECVCHANALTSILALTSSDSRHGAFLYTLRILTGCFEAFRIDRYQ
jgi:hypothetical protein